MAEITVTPAGTFQDQASRASGTFSRSLGFTSLFAIGLLGMSLASAGMLPFSTLAGTWPGTSLILLLSVGLGISLVHSYTYAAIGTAVPRAGADYVLASRTISAPLAFASSFAFVVVCGLSAGGLLAYLPRTLLPIFMRIFAVVTDNPNLLSFGEAISSPNGIVMIGTICAVIAFVGAMLPPKVLRRSLEIGMIFMLVSWILLFIQLGFAETNAFPAAFNRFVGASSYDTRFDLALGLGMNINSSPGIPPAALFTGFWVFMGAFIPSIMPGEVKKPGRDLLLSSWAALIVSWALLSCAALLLNRLAPSSWVAAESFLYLQGFEGASPWLVLYAAALRSSPLLILTIAVAWVYALINLAQIYFTFLSRIAYSWSNDGLLPANFHSIPSRHRVPLLSLFLIGVLVEIGVVLNATGNGLISQTSLIFVVAGAQVMPVLSSILFPYLRRKWFLAAPGFVRIGLKALPVMSIVGIATLAYLIYLLAATFMYPLHGLPAAFDALYLFLALMISGIVWYYLRKRHLMLAGIDIRQLTQVLPHEPISEEN